jgi:hypothetical protein
MYLQPADLPHKGFKNKHWKRTVSSKNGDGKICHLLVKE